MRRELVTKHGTSVSWDTSSDRVAKNIAAAPAISQAQNSWEGGASCDAGLCTVDKGETPLSLTPDAIS
jgi:hypothetical protein